ncbi:hypothetical protein HanPI659440_Chr06g0236701 [Helianthus annuus]|nr:hypothetical protein HanPI659440_Chr06g0236701 [Helianthus annuus]
MTHSPSSSHISKTKFMPNQSSIIHHKKKINRQPIQSKIATWLSKSSMDSTPILASETTDANQDHKRRCFEKLVVRRERVSTQQNAQDVKCAVEAEVIDDTALIEITDVVTGFKNRCRNETHVGYGKSYVNDGSKRRNKGFKKPGERCSMKCVKEKKVYSQGVEDEKRTGNKICEGKGQKVCRKMADKVKYGYRIKDTKNPKSITTGVEQREKVEDRKVLETIFGEAVQETDVNLKVSVWTEKESTPKFALEKIFDEADQETDLNLKVSDGIEKESTTKLVEETEAAVEKGDVLKLDPIVAVQAKNNEAEDENLYENATVGSKKIVYSRDEIEALRSVDEEGQKSKWMKVYSGFAPAVAREYAGLVADAYNRPTQRTNILLYTRRALLQEFKILVEVPSSSPLLPIKAMCYEITNLYTSKVQGLIRN